MADPRRPNKIFRYKPPNTETNPTLEDPTPDYMNLLGMIFSMCGLMLKFCQFTKLRGHQTNDEQLHAVHIGRRDVVFAEPTAHVATVVTNNPKPSKPSQQGRHENQLIHPLSFWNAGMYTHQPSWPIGD
ncbi:PAT complex subunit Asterix [Labeo rohita]|uniref:PAT complex subunit Asterix n=1 Tax=Labeo rohita TaxID=84645 RepID=A0ABQ8M8B3_LABRO|nr:PAT complex subunit Asterix [Labeo rohita]